MKTLICTFAFFVCSCLFTNATAKKPELDLTGYVSDGGAITVLHKGDSLDPYFAMQALLMAHENGWDITAPAGRFAQWLVPRQKPDGTFDRFCRSAAAPAWISCKTSDADDSLLALWLKLLETQPNAVAQDARLQQSVLRSKAALAHLYQPSQGIYMVSPVVLHGLFMDNLEVWSYKVHRSGAPRDADTQKLAQAIRATFWDPANQVFRVSTQMEQQALKPTFYPHHVAQIFPLLVDFPQMQGGAKQHYKRWMAAHRDEWLSQGKADYPWGLIAVLALRQNDSFSARCWLREAANLRHSDRWAITDEVAYQIIVDRKLRPAAPQINCK